MDKASFRQECVKRLQTAAKQNKRSKELQVMKVLSQIIREVGAESILFYLPLGFELDLRTLLNRQKRNIKKCYVPFMVGESFKMVPYRRPLRQANFGVLEPLNTHRKIKDVDVAIVPVIGVDAVAKRIGFGKGMYDRFFASLPRKPITIFVQLDECICEQIITDDYDIQADFYITPKTIKYRNINDKSDSLRRWDRYRQRSNRLFDLKKIK